MGKLENEHKQRIRRGQIQHAILASVSAVGILAVSLVAPNAIRLLKTFGLDDKLSEKFDKSKNAIYFSRRRLVKNGLVRYENGFLIITERGIEKLRHLELGNFRLEKPKRWDKKWRVLIFDIKEKRRDVRDKLRRTLITIGFVRLQDSVWVYPYSCDDLITLLKSDFKIGKELLYLIVDTIENDESLKKSFNLLA